jgi:hypothetical protein
MKVWSERRPLTWRRAMLGIIVTVIAAVLLANIVVALTEDSDEE